MLVDIRETPEGYILECTETGETLPGSYSTEEDARICGEEYSELYELGRSRAGASKPRFSYA